MKWLPFKLRSKVKAKGKSGALSRSVNYGTSPLLASKTPPWRSKFVVALVGLGSCVLVARAVSIQIIDNKFYLAQGDKRYLHQQELQASRGRITDRHGALLATSVPVPSVWAIPKDVQATREQKRELARLLGLPLAEVEKETRRPQRALRVAEAPGRRHDVAADQQARHQGRPRVARVQAQIPRGRSRGACGRLHRRR